MGAVSKAVIVVPCYNEEARFASDGFASLLREGVDLLFVDDGSRDGTASVLARFCAAHPTRARSLSLAANRGKAEAVREGMRNALDSGALVVGYLDADLATPPHELLRLLDEMHARGAAVVLGARVQLLGSRIDRRRARHYLGRIFATAASAVLDLPVYDTQCGAKLFRSSPALVRALEEPFLSRWVFDVELLGRLRAGGEDGDGALDATDFLEVPLREWADVGGSKLGPSSMARSGLELVRIGLDMRNRRRRT